MKHRISVKIFAVIMVGVLIILGISMKLNIEAQKGLYSSWIKEKYEYWNIGGNISETFSKYIDHSLSQEEFLKIVNNQDLQQELRTVCPEYQNYIFLTQNDTKQQKRHILFYTLGQDKDQKSHTLTICDQKNQFQDLLYIYSLGDEHIQEIVDAVQNQNKNIIQNGRTNISVEYQINEDNEITYFNGLDIQYGKKPKEYKQGYIKTYCKNDTYETITLIDKKNEYNETNFSLIQMKNIVENETDGEITSGGYLTYQKQKDNQTYFIMNMKIDNVPEEFNIFVMNVVNDMDEIVLEEYYDQNLLLYIFALIISLLISLFLSYHISKPIKKLEKATLKIAQQDFDEDITIKSEDEIGNLAKSIDTMRIQLKDTINKLNQEIEHVKELESLRKDFINQFTHEMKTPLGIINGYSELIEETDNQEDIQKYLDIINRETSRVNELIQSMLNLSRLESGKVQLHKEDIDLEDIVTEIIDEYEILMMKKNIKIEIHTHQTHIHADQKQIITVIQNFMSNAMKHTYENRKIIMTIDQGLSIYNEGETIDENQLKSIWYTFVTHDQQGTGLGLAICRTILELHDFDYGVENKENGVEFYFHE